MTGAFALVLRDPRLRTQIGKLAESLGAASRFFDTPETLELEDVPAVIVVELEMDWAVDKIAAWKQRWPGCFIAASLALPRPDLWHAAIASGCTLVANRGALPRQLEKQFEESRSGTANTLVPRLLVRLGERSGDGLVGNLPDAPDGPIVVYRAQGRLCAIFDACPHAQASLADGELEGSVLTCPAHGSQFDVCTGARLRGPSDFPVRTYRVVQDGERVYVEL